MSKRIKRDDLDKLKSLPPAYLREWLRQAGIRSLGELEVT